MSGVARRHGETVGGGGWLPNAVVLVLAFLMVAAATISTAFLQRTGERAEADSTLRIVTGRDIFETGIYQELIDEFNATRPEGAPEVELVEIGGGANLERAEMVRWLQSDHVEYDVLNVDNQWIAEFARAGWIEPIGDDIDTSRLLDRPLTAVTYGRWLYAVPFVTDVGVLYYRTDLAPELGQHLGTLTTWSGTLRTLAEVAHGSDTVDYGFTGQYARYEGFTVNMLEIAANHENGEVDEGTLTSLAGGPARDALELVATALENGTMPRGALDDTEPESFQRFVNGEVVAIRSWPAWHDELTRAGARPQGRSNVVGGEPGEVAAEGIEFDILPLPNAVLGGQSLALNSDSPHREGALELIRFLTDAPQQRLLFYCGGYVPVREDAFFGRVRFSEGSEGGCPGESAPIQGATVESRRGHYADDLLARLSGGGADDVTLRPTNPYYPQYSRIFNTELHALLSGSSAELAAEETSAELDAELVDVQERLRAALVGS